MLLLFPSEIVCPGLLINASDACDYLQCVSFCASWLRVLKEQNFSMSLKHLIILIVFRTGGMSVGFAQNLPWITIYF